MNSENSEPCTLVPFLSSAVYPAVSHLRFLLAITTVPSSCLTTMSTRELRSLGGTDRPGGRKWLQSNTDDVSAKRTKTNDNDSDDEEQPVKKPVKKAATKGKGKKGKKPMYVLFLCEGVLPGNTNLRLVMSVRMCMRKRMPPLCVLVHRKGRKSFWRRHCQVCYSP